MNTSRIFTYIIIAVVIPFFIGLAVNSTRKHDLKNIESKYYTIQAPKLIFWIAFINFILSITLILCVNIVLDKNELGDSGLIILNCMSLFILITSIFLLLVYRRKIVVDGDEIEYTRSFGRKSCFNFREISKVVLKSYNRGTVRQETYIIYVGEKKIFTIGNTYKNSLLFLKHATELNVEIIDLRK